MRSERGVSLIEFALVLPFFLVVFAVGVDFSRAFYVKNLVGQLSREAARMGSETSEAGYSAVEDSVYIHAGPYQLKNLGITITDVQRWNAEHTVSWTDTKAVVKTDFDWIFPGMLRWLGVPSSTSTLLWQTEMRKVV